MVTATIERRDPEVCGRSQVCIVADVEIEHRAHDLVDQHCHFHGRADDFQFVQQKDVLTVRGRVPSFYLKQVLQTVLRDLNGMCRIDNRVDVVSCDGLSSVHERSTVSRE